jgi:hypothetical protein
MYCGGGGPSIADQDIHINCEYILKQFYVNAFKEFVTEKELKTTFFAHLSDMTQGNVLFRVPFLCVQGSLSSLESNVTQANLLQVCSNYYILFICGSTDL